jgi:hypothetical protein
VSKVAACDIAQQYSSITCVSLRLHSRTEEFGGYFEKYIIRFFTYLKLGEHVGVWK